MGGMLLSAHVFGLAYSAHKNSGIVQSPSLSYGIPVRICFGADLCKISVEVAAKTYNFPFGKLINGVLPTGCGSATNHVSTIQKRNYRRGIYMFCGNCGKEIIEGTKFCGNCGTPVSAFLAEAQTMPETQITPEVQAAPEMKPAPEAQVISEVLTASEAQVDPEVSEIPAEVAPVRDLPSGQTFTFFKKTFIGNFVIRTNETVVTVFDAAIKLEQTIKKAFRKRKTEEVTLPLSDIASASVHISFDFWDTLYAIIALVLTFFLHPGCILISAVCAWCGYGKRISIQTKTGATYSIAARGFGTKNEIDTLLSICNH